jgi:predicted amidophosphoribosyltransferase
MSKVNDPLKSLAKSPTTSAIAEPNPKDEIVRVGKKHPMEDRLVELWHFTYRTLIAQIFAKGLSYYNAKDNALKTELELAVRRADEAVRAFIRVRKETPDPIFTYTQEWYKELDPENPLA